MRMYTGRDMVEFLEQGMSFHIAQELAAPDDDADIRKRLERAFIMADIHSRHAGVTMSGATVAVCLLKVRASTTSEPLPASRKPFLPANSLSQDHIMILLLIHIYY
jgi:hypothetical protein